jgi:hypothetical protein
MKLPLASCLLLVFGCQSSSHTNTDLSPTADLSPTPDLAPPADLAVPPEPGAGADATVSLFDKRLFAFDNSGNTREGTATVDLPSVGTYAKITLHVALTCPSGGCDPYDRIASIGVIQPGSDAGAASILEVGRFATPFGVAGAWDIDVTDLRPLLSGTVEIHGLIDTWVGNGKGWLLSAQLVYVGGVPANIPVAVLPLPWSNFNIGDPSQPVSTSLPPQMVTLPAGTTHAAVRVNATGHGQGNADNCGEFCTLNHSLLVNNLLQKQFAVWRDDCAQNPLNKQNGTWMYSRAGWCPGSDVKPITIDLGARSGPFSVGYAIDSYVNTCSPGATCNTASCTLGTSCDYDGGSHTTPFIDFSAVVIAYR